MIDKAGEMAPELVWEMNRIGRRRQGANDLKFSIQVTSEWDALGSRPDQVADRCETVMILLRIKL